MIFKNQIYSLLIIILFLPSIVYSQSWNKIGGDIQKSPEPINFEIVNQNDNEITFISPNKKGAYRIFAFVKNEKGQSSVANIPFLVE